MVFHHPSFAEARNVLRSLSQMNSSENKNKEILFSRNSILTEEKSSNILASWRQELLGWHRSPKKLCKLIKRIIPVLEDEIHTKNHNLIENEIGLAISGLSTLFYYHYQDKPEYQEFVQKAIKDLLEVGKKFHTENTSHTEDTSTVSIEDTSTVRMEDTSIASSDSSSSLTSDSLSSLSGEMKIFQKNIGNQPPELQKKAASLFSDNYQSAYERAIKLHENFKAKFAEEGKVVIDQKTGIIKSSKEQLQEALSLARSSFGELLILANTPEERLKATRLIQIIMVGEEESQLPETIYCFTVYNTITTEQESDLLPENKSFIVHSVEKIAEGESLKNNLQTVAIAFTEDVIERGVMDVSINQRELKLGVAGQKEGYPSLFDVVALQYQYHLIENPEKTKEIILKNQASELFKAARLYSPTDDSSESSFSEQTLKNIMNEAMSSWITHVETTNMDDAVKEKRQIMQSQFDQLFTASRLHEETIGVIQTNLKEIGFNADVKDIEPLVRMKLLELMIAMNQGTMASLTVKLFEKMYGLQIVGMPLVLGKNTAYTFESGDFESYSNDLDFSVSTYDQKPFKEEGIQEIFEGKMDLFQVGSSYIVPSTNTIPDYSHQPRYNLIDQIFFSYQTPNAVINSLSY